MRVSVLGMGRMGVALAVRLAKAGQEVTVWNRSSGKAGPALSAGAHEAQSLDEAVSGAEAVVVMVSDDDAVRELVLGEDGVAHRLGGDAVLVNSSSVSPVVTTELADRVERFAAMPVVGSPDAVESGQARYLLGGPAEVLDALSEVTSALSEQVVRLEEPAQAVVAKVVGNYLLLTGLATLAEALEVGRAGGLDDARLTDLFGDNPLVAPALRNRFETVRDRSPEGWFALGLGAKDLGLALDLAGSVGVELPAGSRIAQLYRDAEKVAPGGADVAAVGQALGPAGSA